MPRRTGGLAAAARCSRTGCCHDPNFSVAARVNARRGQDRNRQLRGRLSDSREGARTGGMDGGRAGDGAAAEDAELNEDPLPPRAADVPRVSDRHTP